MSLQALLVQQDAPTIYAAALQIAQTLGLPVTSWQPGDPTRSLYFLEAETLSVLEAVAVGYIQSGFLDYATGEWLTILAQQVYNVIVPGATFATTSVTLTNAGGATYTIEQGDLTLKNSTSGATYHNTDASPITLTGVGTPGASVTITVVADLAGSVSSAGAGEIDTLVTTLLGVTCTNPAAATGLDVQAPATTIAQCRNKLASLSPNGPAGAYAYVALNQALTGVQTVTRVRVYPDSEVGAVTIFVASPSGTVPGGDVTSVQNAILQWATPLCITPTTLSANPVTVPVTYTVWLYSSVNATTSQIQTQIQTALENFFAIRPIGGDIIPPALTGALYQSMIESVIGQVFPGQTFRVTVSLPSGDTSLNNGDVPVLGTVTGNVNIIPGP